MKPTISDRLIYHEEEVRSNSCHLPVQIEDMKQAAHACLQRLPQQATADLALWRVYKLGCLAKERSMRVQAEQQALTLAGVLGCGQQPFSLGFHSTSGGEGAFVVGSSHKKLEQVQGCMRSVFGIADVGAFAVGKKYPYHSWCVTQRMLHSEEDAPLSSSIKPIAWLDSLARAAVGRDCWIEMTFAPVENAWLHQAVEEAAQNLDELSPYQEISRQLSVSSAHSITHIDNIAQNTRNWIKGSVHERPASEDDSLSSTVNLSNSAIQQLCQLLQQRLNFLNKLKNGFGWSVSLRISAADKGVLEMLQSIAGAAMAPMGLSCCWEMGYASLSTSIGAASTASLLLPSSDLPLLACAPSKEFGGFQMEELRQLAVNPPRTDEPGVEIGSVLHNGYDTGVKLKIPLSSINRHMLAVGECGGGKTNSIFAMLEGLSGIPFLVIEPVKGEYRALKHKYPDLKVYTMQAGSSSQLCMNPFWFPQKGSLQYHIASLKAIISSAFDLYEAMPNVLGQCITNVYIKLGWDIQESFNVNEGKLPSEMLYPTFTMLCEEVKQYLKHSKYSDEVKGNYEAALLNRLQDFTTGSTGALLDCSSIPPVEEWLKNDSRCVLELDALPAESERAIVMGTILMQYYQARMNHGHHAADQLRHVIVLEEAHHLFQRSTEAANGNNSKEELVKMLNKMMTDIRAYGEGIIVVDQSPSCVSAQVLDNTVVKLVHRITSRDGLDALDGSLLLEDEDAGTPSALGRGEALIRFDNMSRPAHVRVGLCETKQNAGIQHDDLPCKTGANHLLDMFKHDPQSASALQNKCRALVNHLLFDEMVETLGALQEACAVVRMCAIKGGYDRKMAEAIPPVSYQMALDLYMEKALLAAYPSQGLVRSKILMAVTRFVELQLLSTRKLRSCEWILLKQYIDNEILPDLSFWYENASEPVPAKLSKQLAPENRCYTGVIAQLYAAIDHELLAADSADRAGLLKQILSLPAEEAIIKLGVQVFAVQPSAVLCRTLWMAVQCMAAQ